MKELRIVGVSLFVVGAALAATMQGIRIYVKNTDPTSVAIVPSLFLPVGLFIALAGLLVFLVWVVWKKRLSRS